MKVRTGTRERGKKNGKRWIHFSVSNFFSRRFDSGSDNDRSAAVIDSAGAIEAIFDMMKLKQEQITK
ncbi:MAG: hypothetical protein NC238_06415 [Dehalobacter sp.]|nr:hypothetical protein [Dehalobacter sp.]